MYLQQYYMNSRGGQKRRFLRRVCFVFKLRIPIKIKVTRPGGLPPLIKSMGHG